MEGHITASRANFTNGIQSFTSTASIADLIVDPRGDILKAGNTTTTPGLCYFLSGSNFIEADLGGSSLLKSGSMNNLLGIAIGTNSGTDGMLIKGFCNHNLNTGQGSIPTIFNLQQKVEPMANSQKIVYNSSNFIANNTKPQSNYMNPRGITNDKS